MMELEQAQERILSLTRPLGQESVPLLSAAGRVLAQDAISAVDLPPFDNSAMDGYALRVDDVARATPEQPVRLKLAGRVVAGSSGSEALGSGQCVRLFTGSPVPAGADGVVMQEDTRVDPEDPEFVWILEGIKPWENIRFKGEDAKRGMVLLEAGERLGATQVGLLGASGCTHVEAARQPTVGLIATGSELREGGQALAPGQIYESNRTMLAVLATNAGARARIYPLIKDSLTETQAALTYAFSECDTVVTSGGVSVGELDFVKAAFKALGGELEFWRVAVKPGKPFALGRWQEKLFFGLPGNPVSAFVTFVLLVCPALLRLQGAREPCPPVRPGVLAESVVNRGERRHFLRVSLDRTGQVRPLAPQASHLLHSLARASGLVDVPPNTRWEAGTPVSVTTW